MVKTSQLRLRSKGNHDVMDITPQVTKAVKDSGLKAGIATVFVSGSTAGVTTVEYEPGLVADLEAMFEKIAPAGVEYRHNLRWGDGNGHAHLRASLLGPSLTVPFAEGELSLGTWQQIVVIDFDIRPRSREVVLQVMGE
ncbi:MAG: secondary thiamine-phosphate synthase enzyme YjbQ [Chloroflexota bacterium]|nr:secondary thiamine-phosphate synthase enzyme YjbQ [Chloroflexota bacterium]